MRFYIVLAILVSLSQAFLQKSLFLNHHIQQKTSLYETTADFKNGMTFEIDNVPHKLVEFLHVKPGKGSAFVRSKVKNLVTGN